DQIFDHQAKYGVFETTLILNSIYTTCLAYNITPLFVATWIKIEIMPELSLIPEANWLLPPTTTLLEVSWNFETPQSAWKVIINKRSELFQKYIKPCFNHWKFNFRSSDEIYDKYVKPCKNHPNLVGHQLIADKLYELLLERVK
ncbi:MAG: hypothetical protein EBU90_20400, partial [Proteobacteria bacterium]|nr:hypothetical protein [Pseudomonadota bacterium]